MLKKIHDLYYNFTHKLCIGWGTFIKQLSNKRKEWLQKKSDKIMRKRTLRNKRRKRYINNNAYEINKYGFVDESKNQYTAKAPECLSIVNNCEETIDYFNGILDDMTKKHQGRLYFFDISEVKHLTNDALMYILAILFNLKSESNAMYSYSFAGNRPNDLKARRQFHESGFLRYVESADRHIPTTGEKLQIVSGNGADGVVASEIIEFVSKSANIARGDLRLLALYRVLVELMSNTKSHAYKEHVLTIKNWYVFAEKQKDSVKLVFLDTGIGIPATIRKKGLGERIGAKADRDLVLAAFTESLRSSTKLSYRGYGLPSTYRICKQSLLKEFTVISGRGKCKILSDRDELIQLNKKLKGTIYYWEVA